MLHIDEEPGEDKSNLACDLVLARALKRKLNSSERVAGADGAATVTNVPQFNNPAAVCTPRCWLNSRR